MLFSQLLVRQKQQPPPSSGDIPTDRQPHFIIATPKYPQGAIGGRLRAAYPSAVIPERWRSADTYRLVAD